MSLMPFCYCLGSLICLSSALLAMATATSPSLLSYHSPPATNDYRHSQSLFLQSSSSSSSSSSPTAAAAKQLNRFGDRCQRVSDCLSQGNLVATGVVCRWASSSCGAGFCTCDDDYVEDPDNSRCNRAVKLGQSCSRQHRDVCTTPNSQCDPRAGLCLCQAGFIVGPRGDDCVPGSVAMLSFGQSCYFRIAFFRDAACAYNLVCTPAGCQCPPGFSLDADSSRLKCIPVRLGEPCTEDADCSQNVFALCASKQRRQGTRGRCVCRPGYRRVRHSVGGLLETRCIRVSAIMLGEGDYCGDAYPFETPLATMSSVCSEPYSCTACWGTHSPARICAVASTEARATYAAAVALNGGGRRRRRQRMLGDRCDSMYRAECVLPNTDCINGICQCLPGSGCVFSDFSNAAAGALFDLRRRSVVVGRPCSQNADCGADGSLFCRTTSQSCWRPPISSSAVVWASASHSRLVAHRGVCACTDSNFAQHTYRHAQAAAGRLTMVTCSKRLRLGDICSKSRTDGQGICASENSDCLFGVCQCVSGFKMAPWGDECVADSQMRYHGEKCLFSEECYFSQATEFPLACLDNSCACLAGTRPALAGPNGSAYGCLANRLGDACLSDTDCHMYWRNKWHCSTATQRCECNEGYYATKVSLQDGTLVTRWCVSFQAPLQAEGAKCKQNIQSLDESTICAQPLVCSSCQDVTNSEDGFCGWPPTAQPRLSPIAVISARTSENSEPSRCLATPIDSDIGVLLAPAHCVPSPDAVTSQNKLLVEIVFVDRAARMNLSVTAQHVVRHPTVDMALVHYQGFDGVDTWDQLPAALELPTAASCDELFNCSTRTSSSTNDDNGDNEDGTREEWVDVIATSQCQREYGQTVVPGGYVGRPKTICAGRHPVDASDTCRRQSSYGPLTCRDASGQLVVAGLPVRLSACPVGGLPRVFTRVCYGLDWIASTRAVLRSLQSVNCNC